MDTVETLCIIAALLGMGADALKFFKGDAFKLLKNGDSLNYSYLKKLVKDGTVDLKSNIKQEYKGLKANIKSLDKVEDISRSSVDLSKLTQEEINAINKYTGNDYREINRSLRGLEEASEANKVTIKNAKSALDKVSLPEDMTLYRGTDKVELGSLKDLPPEDLIGKTFKQPSFLSTSKKNTVAAGTFQGNMHMTIEAPKGLKGMDIASISQYGETEAEVLFQAGTEMIIKDAKMVDNVLHIVVEIID